MVGKEKLYVDFELIKLIKLTLILICLFFYHDEKVMGEFFSFNFTRH